MKTIVSFILLSFISMTLFSQENVEILKVKLSHHKVYTDIIIDADPEQVWEVLMDFESYSKWAVFFKGMKGEIQDSGKVIALFQMNPKKSKVQEIEHTITYKEGKMFGWSEHVILGIKDHHRFIVEEANDGKTRFIQSDEFTKGGTWLLGGYISKLLSRRYPEFNRSLKSEVERRYINK